MATTKATALAHTIASTTSTTDELNLVDGSVSGPLSHRNIVINGAMQVAQRGNSHTGVSTYAYHLDRFETALQGIGAYTITQSTTAPTSEGFARSYKIDCTTADASPAATDFFFIRQKIEGQNLQQLCKGTSDAKSVTLSFWCRCTKTGNIQVNLNDSDNNRIIGQAVSINSTNTWEKKTLTFAGDTSGVLGNDNGASLAVEWWLDKGSNFSGGLVPTSWETLNNADRAVGCTLALGDNTANDFYLTGVQLELGSVATPFEHRSYGDELARCQRYYWQPDLTTNDYGPISIGSYHSSTLFIGTVILPVTPRGVPQLTTSGTFQVTSKGASANASAIVLTDPNIHKCVQLRCTASGTNGAGALFRTTSFDETFALNMEL